MQLVLAALLSMYGALTLVPHVHDFVDERRTPWYIHNRPHYHPWILPLGVGWFAAVEAATVIDGRLRRRAAPPPAARLPQAGASE